ncbi:MAG: hypothetical protein IIW40_01300 [Clostridia bacterium]|nr:hypothetical protein [Clostridia bacterium]
MKKIFAVLLAVMLLGAMSFSAFAADSPVGTVVNKVTIKDGADATPIVKEVKVGEELELKADADKGKFDGWKIYKADGTEAKEGVDYKLAEGAKLTDATLRIIPMSAITVAANYGGVVTPVKPQGDKPVSPPTGDTVVALLAAVMALALVGVGVAKKQLA